MNNHINDLENVRQVLVEERRKVAAMLNPKDPLLAGKNILEIQNALRAVDLALSEEVAAGSGMDIVERSFKCRPLGNDPW